MKYFTPELIVSFRSCDDDMVDEAEAAWERAITRYRRHYRKIKQELPESVRKFHDECCLHDADVFGPASLSVQTLPWGFCDVVLVAQNINTHFPEHLNTLMFLQYAVTAEATVERPVPSKVFHTAQPIWLYDEFDVIEPGVFSHEILISDGRVVKLTFREFHYQIAKLIASVRKSGEKEVAQDKMASA